jgi:hypothetical protein
MEMKRCTKCNEPKLLEEFNRDASSKDGHRNDCRACQNTRGRAYTAANPEKERARIRDWHRKRSYASSMPEAGFC